MPNIGLGAGAADMMPQRVAQEQPLPGSMGLGGQQPDVNAEEQLLAQAIEESMKGGGAMPQPQPGYSEEEELARILEMSKNQM